MNSEMTTLNQQTQSEYDDRIPCPECGELDYQAALLQDNTQIVCTNCGHTYRDE